MREENKEIKDSVTLDVLKCCQFSVTTVLERCDMRYLRRQRDPPNRLRYDVKVQNIREQ